MLMLHPLFLVPFALFFFTAFASPFGNADSATPEAPRCPSAPLGSSFQGFPWLLAYCV